MGKIEAAIAIGVGIKEAIEEISNIFQVPLSGDYYKCLDDMTFLTTKTLGLESGGGVIDNLSTLGGATLIISNLVVWGVFLFYCFCSLFQYFMSRKIEVPWKVIIRAVIFGVFINSAFFICYFATYLTENITNYIVESCGGSTSFSYIEDSMADYDMEVDPELENDDFLVIENLMDITLYIFLLALGIALGTRLIFMKVIVVLSPIIIAFGCSKITEKIFIISSKIFLKLLSCQIIIAIILEIFKSFDFPNSVMAQVIVISTTFISIVFIKKICKNY